MASRPRTGRTHPQPGDQGLGREGDRARPTRATSGPGLHSGRIASAQSPLKQRRLAGLYRRRRVLKPPSVRLRPQRRPLLRWAPPCSIITPRTASMSARGPRGNRCCGRGHGRAEHRHLEGVPQAFDGRGGKRHRRAHHTGLRRRLPGVPREALPGLATGGPPPGRLVLRGYAYYPRIPGRVSKAAEAQVDITYGRSLRTENRYVYGGHPSSAPEGVALPQS